MSMDSWSRNDPRIRAIWLDRWELPQRAIIRTKFGPVRVRWRKFGTKRLWFASGSLNARVEALTAIEHIEYVFV